MSPFYQFQPRLLSSASPPKRYIRTNNSFISSDHHSVPSLIHLDTNQRINQRHRLIIGNLPLASCCLNQRAGADILLSRNFTTRLSLTAIPFLSNIIGNPDNLAVSSALFLALFYISHPSLWCSLNGFWKSVTPTK